MGLLVFSVCTDRRTGTEVAVVDVCRPAECPTSSDRVVLVPEADVPHAFGR